MLDIHRLKIFVRVAEFKNFSKAAQVLYLTQPTVSQHIASLEQFVGLPLFDRTGKEASLTRAGEILYDYARQIIILQDEAEQALNHFRGKKSGHIMLGASNIPGEYILPNLLGIFKKLYPEIQITIRISNTESIVNELLNHTIELGMVGACIKDERLQYSRFVNDELIFIIPRGHRLWSVKKIYQQEVLEEPFVIRERGSGTRMSMEKQLLAAGIRPDRLKIIAEVGSTTAIKEAVKAHLGIALISGRAVTEELKLGIFKKLEVEGLAFTRTFYIVTEKKRTPSPLCKALLKFLAEQK